MSAAAGLMQNLFAQPNDAYARLADDSSSIVSTSSDHLGQLGNSIERLNEGRLNDQRAVHNLNPSPSRQLDRLIQQIDRASSRSLTDQRAEFDPLALSDRAEAQRRNVILSTSGKGRLDSQDANLSLFVPKSTPASAGDGTGRVVLVHSPLDFVAEESRSLGTVQVTFWRREPSTALGSEGWTVLAVESESLLVGPSHGGPASRLALPCRVIPQPATVTASGSAWEVKLVTIDPSPTRPRHDLEVIAPLSTGELRKAMAEMFACATCDTPLVHGDRVKKYNALPSEHWAELLESWMCHQDQTLNEDLIAKGRGIKPREDEAMVASGHILFPKDLTTNWVTPEQSEVGRTDANDEVHVAECAQCGSLIGQHVVSSGADGQSSSFVRLLKYATYPVGLTPRYSLAAHLSAEMLELGQAHACHRFVVENAEDDKARLLLWFFNPAVRIAFSTSSISKAVLAEPQDKAAQSASQLGRTMNAVKVFYTIVEDESDKVVRAFVENEHSTTERLPFPREIVDRLTETLLASSLVYPEGKRTWGEMDAGFLERI